MPAGVFFHSHTDSGRAFSPHGPSGEARSIPEPPVTAGIAVRSLLRHLVLAESADTADAGRLAERQARASIRSACARRNAPPLRTAGVRRSNSSTPRCRTVPAPSGAPARSRPASAPAASEPATGPHRRAFRHNCGRRRRPPQRSSPAARPRGRPQTGRPARCPGHRRAKIRRP